MTAVRLLGAVFVALAAGVGVGIVLLVGHAAFLDLRDWFRARRACPVRRLAEDQWDYADDDYPDQDERSVPMPKDQHDPERQIQADIRAMHKHAQNVLRIGAETCPTCGLRWGLHAYFDEVNAGCEARRQQRVVKPAEGVDGDA